MKTNKHTPPPSFGREDWLRQARSGNTQLPADPADEFSRRVFAGLQYADGASALRQSLGRIDAGIDRLAAPAPEIRRPGLMARMGAPIRLAAAILLILAVAAAVRILVAPPSAKALFARYFEPIDSAIPLTGYLRADQQATDLKSQALSLYEGRQYTDAIPLLDEYLKQHSDDQQVRLYYGVALLAADQWKSAIGPLDRAVRHTTDPLYQSSARWYLALAYLRTGDKDRAAEQLRRLSGPDGSRTYGLRAGQLLNDMRIDDGDLAK